MGHNKWPTISHIIQCMLYGTKLLRLVDICDQNGDRVSKYNKSCHIYSLRQKELYINIIRYGTQSIYTPQVRKTLV